MAALRVGSLTGEATALEEEILGAFGLSRRKENKREQLASNSDLVWLHQQCSLGRLYPLYTGDRSKLTILDKQTYRRWKSAMEMERVKHPLRHRRRVVLIQPITHRHGSTTSVEEEVGYGHTLISEKVLNLLQEFCAAYFSEMEVKLAPSLDLSEIPRLTSRIHKATNRRQFLVDDIIHFLSTRKLRKAYCILGVTIVDLYPGSEWNFVLGQACMEKGSGVFSFGRFFNSAVSSDGSEHGLGEEECGRMQGNGIQAELEKDQIGNLWVLMRVRLWGWGWEGKGVRLICFTFQTALWSLRCIFVKTVLVWSLY